MYVVIFRGFAFICLGRFNLHVSP